jgi:hypothetical protein
MNQVLLEQFQQAYQDLDLFPLVKAEGIEKFRAIMRPPELLGF